VEKEVKIKRTSQQNFTIRGVFLNVADYLMMRSTLFGGLQEVYIGGNDDP
jgi:hypothetical protein